MASLATLGCLAEERAPALRNEAVAQSLDVDEQLEANGETIAYENIRHKASDDEDSTLVTQTGSVDLELFQRYARPFAYMSSPDRHYFHALRTQLEDGTIEEGVRVTTAETGAADDITEAPATLIDPALLEADGQDAVRVLTRIRNFPDWDVPLVPGATTVDAETYADALDAKADAIQARMDLLEERASPLTEVIEAAGGTVGVKFWSIGWIGAEIPTAVLEELATHPDVHTVSPAAATSGTGAGRSDLRPAEMSSIQPYWTASQFGDQPNSDRHLHGAMVVASIDSGPVKDEAGAFCTTSACTANKFVKRFRCDQRGSNPCILTSNYPTSLENQNVTATNHATTVAATVVADYLDGQPAGVAGGGGFTADAATSDAREAKLIAAGALGGTNGYPGDGMTSYTAALEASIYWEADVITSGTFITESTSSTGTCTNPSPCNITGGLPVEMAAENAFDAGAFLAVLPTNSCGPSLSRRAPSPHLPTFQRSSPSTG